MADILGLTVTHFPALRNKYENLTTVLKSTIAGGWGGKVHLADPVNWPEQMRREWGSDEGTQTAKNAQEHMIGELRRVKEALDEFQPDIMLMLYRDHSEGWRKYVCPQYWILACESVEVKLFPKVNYFDEDSERVDTIHGHREAAFHLVRELQERGLKPVYCLEPNHPTGLDHHVQAGLVHLDWDKREFRTPIIPFGLDPIAYRGRSNIGLSARDPNAPQPLTPKEAFELGRAIAQAYHASPWRVAIVATTVWSNYHNTPRDQERVCQNIEADQVRFEQWKTNAFTTWGNDFTFEELDLFGQWDMLTSIVMAGAMSELDSKVRYADFFASPLLISDWVTSVFEVK